MDNRVVIGVLAVILVGALAVSMAGGKKDATDGNALTINVEQEAQDAGNAIEAAYEDAKDEIQYEADEMADERGESDDIDSLEEAGDEINAEIDELQDEAEQN